MSALSKCTDRGDFHRHMVQFYEDDGVLARNVGNYLAEGLTRGERAVVVATPAHTRAFTGELARHGLDASELVHEDRLIYCGARETLARFMIDGNPDPELFDRSVGSLIRELRAKGAGRMRAYGEMVDLLWNAGQSAAASRLEQLWNGLLGRHQFSLLCAYQIDVFGKEFQAGILDDMLRAHSHLFSAESGGDLGKAVNYAVDEVLGARAEGVKLLIRSHFHPCSWAAIPEAESTVLWLRNNLPDYADEILSRARRHYQASLSAVRGQSQTTN
jgi:MEDS: MEthanogen/methylotroph, DcmR Sensory domain